MKVLNLFNRIINRKDVCFKFSTEEQWTGDYWIDGKKIYAKVIQSTKANLENDVNSIGIDTMLYVFGNVRSKFNNTFFIPNSYDLEKDYSIYVYYPNSNSKHIGINFGSYYSDNTTAMLYVIYTKQTE